MQIELSEERQAQLSEYAARHGQEASVALDEVLGNVLEWDRLDFEDTLRCIREGYEDVKAGHTQPASEVFEELRIKYGLPG